MTGEGTNMGLGTSDGAVHILQSPRGLSCQQGEGKQVTAGSGQGARERGQS